MAINTWFVIVSGDFLWSFIVFLTLGLSFALRVPFNISCQTGLVVINSFSLFFRDTLALLLSWRIALLDSFRFFPLSTLSLSCHTLLACQISMGRAAASLRASLPSFLTSGIPSLCLDPLLTASWKLCRLWARAVVGTPTCFLPPDAVLHPFALCLRHWDDVIHLAFYLVLEGIWILLFHNGQKGKLWKSFEVNYWSLTWLRFFITLKRHFSLSS